MADNNDKTINMPDLLTASPSPHMRTKDNTRTVMVDVIIALLPAYIWGIISFGLRALIIGLISVGACIGFEALSEKLLKRPITISDCSAALTGMLLAMNLSVYVPLWMPVVGALFAIVVVKQIFGGIGKNIVNPALAARVFLFSWASSMTKFTPGMTQISSLKVTLADADIVASATPLASLKAGELPSASIADVLFGNIGGCIGEVSAVLLLIGGIYLLSRKVITWHIPVSYIATVALITFIFPKTGVSSTFMLYEIFSGGLMLGAIFMATDYATSPLTARGRIIYGIGCGVITVLIRYFGGYNEGVSFSILIMNLLVWYLDILGKPKPFGSAKAKKKKEAE